MLNFYSLYHIFFIHSPVKGHWGHSHIPAPVSSAAAGSKAVLVSVWHPDFNSFEYTPSVAGPCQWHRLAFPQQCGSIQISPHLHQYMFFLLIIAILLAFTNNSQYLIDDTTNKKTACLMNIDTKPITWLKNGLSPWIDILSIFDWLFCLIYQSVPRKYVLKFVNMI